MYVQAPDKVESAVLYNGDYDAISPQWIIDNLNYCLKPANLSFRILQASRDSSFMLLNGGKFYVLISQNRHPLSANGFNFSLASPFTQLHFPNADEVVYGHKANIFITVSSNLPIPGSIDSLKRLIQMPEPQQTVGEFEVKLTICQLLTNQVSGRNRPVAIQWCQSSQLMKPEIYEQFGRQPFPTALFVHPSLFSSRAVINGTQVIGLKTFGAAHLIGKEIVFNEAPVPLAWMYQRTCNFVDMARSKNGQLTPDGDTFGATRDEVIKVRHCNSSAENDRGAIELTLLQSVEHGYEFDSSAEQKKTQNQTRNSTQQNSASAGKTSFGKRIAGFFN